MWQQRKVGPEDITAVDAALRDWEPENGCAAGFQSGDLGWALGDGTASVASRLRCWINEHGDFGAIGFMEGPAAIWLTIDPARLMDSDLAEVIAADTLKEGVTSISPPSMPAAIRPVLGKHGFAIAPVPWLFFWKHLTDDDIVDVPGVVPTSSPKLIAERVAVKQSAFDEPSFSTGKWWRIAAGPAFRPELDLVALNEAGVGVAALTAWLPGPGKCGIIKAMGTHSDYRRQGHARRVLLASFAALRRLGATSVHLFADRDNDPAIATYTAVGFKVIGYDTEMVAGEKAVA